MSFASTMAASVVAKMLNDPVVFQEWPHCNQDMVKKWKSDEGSTKEKLENMEEMLKQWKSAEDSTKDKVGQVEDMLKKWKSDEGSTKEKLENMEGLVTSEVKEVKAKELTCVSTSLHATLYVAADM
ncbi:uncharacterized protein [Montipora capricornis]|uniref:uncharacterized protein n=1 Tax=Montipora capricornis TaxID=246305 RepID=UPI0035F10C93